MPRPYSLDLRQRVVGAVEQGQSCRAAAELFDVSISSVVKWCQRARENGSPSAKPMGGPLKRKLLGTGGDLHPIVARARCHSSRSCRRAAGPRR